MMKKLLCLLTLCFGFIKTYSQEFRSNQLQLELGAAAGVVSNRAYQNSLIGNASLSLPITEHSRVFAASGISRFIGIKSDLDDAIFVPTKLGIRYHMDEHLFVTGAAGSAFAIQGPEGVNLLYNLGIGYTVKDFALNLNFEDYTTFQLNTLMLGVTYNFKL